MRGEANFEPCVLAGVTAFHHLPDGVHARIDWESWERPPVYGWLAERGIDEEEARRVFNLGIGLCAVVPEAPAGALVIGVLE